MRSRYLLPTYPLTAVLLADLLRQCLRSSVAVHLLERTVRWIVIGGASAGIIVAAAGLRLDTSMLAGGLLFAAFALALYSMTFHRRLVPVLIALSLAICGCLGRSNRPSSRCSSHRQPGRSPAGFLKFELLANRRRGCPPVPDNLIRLMSGGRLVVKEFRSETNPDSLRTFPVILGSERVRQTLGDSDRAGSKNAG